MSNANTAAGLEDIDTATDALAGAPISLPSSLQSSGIALSPDGNELYMADSSAEQLDALTLSTGLLGSPPGTLPAGFVPGQIGVNPDGATAYVDGTAASQTGEVVSIDLSGGGAETPITLASGVEPVGLVLAPAAVNSIPTPTPTPTPTPVCSPFTGIGPVIEGPEVGVGGGAAESSAPSAGATAGTPTPNPPTSDPSPTPTQVISPPADLIGPLTLPTPTPSTGPIMCFGAESVAPSAHPAASLADAAGATPAGGVLLPVGLALLGLAAGGLTIFGRRSWWSLPRFPQWRGR
jgi:hypothetical protein